MISIKKILPVLCLFISAQLIAQRPDRNFKAVDEYARKLGPLDTMNMGTISYTLTRQFPDKLDKVRAIFVWITEHISFDCKAARASDDRKNNSTDILKSRMATGAGYAALFQDMCSVAKIRCLTVDGYAKKFGEEIGEKPDAFNHTWAVVQLGQSQEDWFYVDPTWGSGFTDAKLTTFTKAFNDDYFFADRTIFNYQHFPDNQAWQLGPGVKNKKDFFALPVVKNSAYEFNITQFKPQDGHIKAKVNSPVQFSFAVSGKSDISIVALAFGEAKKRKLKTVDHTITNGVVTFSYKFDDADDFPLTVLINGKEVLEYFIAITE